MKFGISISSERSTKTFKVKRKVSQIPLKLDLESDLALEKEGNFGKFLENETGFKFGPRFDNGKVVPHSVIGPSSLFSAKKIDIVEKVTKKYSVDIRDKVLNAEKIEIDKTEFQNKFNEVMKRINMAREQSAFEEKERQMKEKSSNKPKSIAKIKRKIALENEIIEKTERHYEKYLKRQVSLPYLTARETKVKKVVENPKKSEFFEGKIQLNKFEDHPESFLWYMSLRKDDTSEKLDTFVKIGNPLSGLYTKIKKPNPNFKLSSIDSHKKNDSKQRFEVIGLSKLNLEVEAVKKIGFEALKPELLQTTTIEEESIIEENYDFSNHS